MNRYFARLGQRSNVVPRTSRTGDPSTTPPTERSLEQHSEVVAASPQSPTMPPATHATRNRASPIAPSAVAPPVVAETQTSIAPVTKPSLPSTTRGATRSALDADYLHARQLIVTPAQTPIPIAVAAIANASTEAHVDAAIDGVPTKPHHAVTTTYVHDAGAVDTIRPDSPIAPPTHDRYRVAQSVDAVTSNDLTSNGPTPNDAVRARPVAHAVTSTQSPANRASDSTPTASVTQPSARTAEVHVHIGKIELDVHAPTPPTAAPKQPVSAASPVVPTPARAPRFNAHRYYLRGG